MARLNSYQGIKNVTQGLNLHLSRAKYTRYLFYVELWIWLPDFDPQLFSYGMSDLEL